MRIVAEQKNSRNKSPRGRKKPFTVLFWVFFFIFISFLFFINRRTIQETLEATQLTERLFNRSPADKALPEAGPDEPDLVRGIPLDPGEAPLPPAGWEAPPEAPIREDSGQEPEPLEPPEPPPASRELVSPEPAPPERRDRNLYFMRLDQDGTVVRTMTSRSLAVSNSPLADTFQALLQGPTAEERQQGLVSFIPPGTRILNIRIRGTTVYINFSEEFQFGIFGAEGYAAQLRQIVWTATEFPTVKDVQILIEGRVVNYLGESILIGSPISREDIRF